MVRGRFNLLINMSIDQSPGKKYGVKQESNSKGYIKIYDSRSNQNKKTQSDHLKVVSASFQTHSPGYDGKKNKIYAVQQVVTFFKTGNNNEQQSYHN